MAGVNLAGQRPGPPSETRRSQGPVLIKDFEDPGSDEEKVLPHDPAQARKNYEIGEYYFKRDNYAAAENRFMDAVEYDKSWPESYKKLIETYDKLEQYESAVEVCRRFAENNPESGELSYFNRVADEYKSKLERQVDDKQENRD